MRAPPTNGVTRHGRGERLASSRSTCRVVPPRASLSAAQRVVHASSRSRALGLDTAHLNGRSNSKMEPTRLTVRAIIMALRRAAHFERWTDGRNKEHGSRRRRRNRSWLLRNIGVVCITSESVPRELALSGGGALSSVRSLRVPTRGTSRRRGHVLARGSGVSRSRRCPIRTSRLSRTGGASEAEPLPRSGTVPAGGLFKPLRHHRSTSSVLRVAGVVSSRVPKSPDWIAALGGVAIAPPFG